MSVDNNTDTKHSVLISADQNTDTEHSVLMSADNNTDTKYSVLMSADNNTDTKHSVLMSADKNTDTKHSERSSQLTLWSLQETSLQTEFCAKHFQTQSINYFCAIYRSYIY